MDQIMLVGLRNTERSKHIAAQLGVMTDTINEHATTQNAQTSEIKKFSAEIDDLKSAFTNRAASANLYFSGLPSNLHIEPDDLTSTFFKHIGLDIEFYKFHVLETRKVNSKTPNNFTAFIIESSSSSIADKILQAASKKRKEIPFTAKSIFNFNSDAPIFLSKMLPKYFHNLAYQVRQLKKQNQWSAVWVHDDNVFVKTTDNAQPIIISTMAQLQSLQ